MFAAYDLQGRVVLIKQARTGQEDEFARAQAQAVRMSGLLHPNVVHFYALSTDPLLIGASRFSCGLLLTLSRVVDVLTVLEYFPLGSLFRYIHNPLNKSAPSTTPSL